MTTLYWLAKAKSQVDNTVKSLLHFDTKLENNQGIDFNVCGNPQISTAQSKFGGRSLLMPTGSYLQTNSPIFNFGTSDFTIECCLYLNSWGGGYPSLISMDGIAPSKSTSIELALNGGNPYISFTFADYIQASSPLTLNQWQHFAVTRKNGIFYMFINGVEVLKDNAHLTTLFDMATTSANLGYTGYSTNSYFDGYIDELRISNTARYTTNFTPQTTPFMDDVNTLLLLHFNDNFTNFYKDDINRTWTTAGTPKLTTTNAKFGSKSLYLGGNTSINCTSSEFNFGTSDFTLETFVLGGVQATVFPSILSSNINGKGSLFFSDVNNGNKPSFECEGVRVCTSDTAISDSIWHHITLTRKDGVFYLFVDGVLKSSNSSYLTNLIDLTNLTLGICPYSTSNSQFNGYIDELRISNTARYTSNFTPPTAPFSLNSANSYYSYYSYYSYKTNSWVDVGLPTTDADIATLFVNQGTNTCPTQQQLELLGTGTNRPNRCCYQPVVATQPTININAVPTGKTVKPVELLPISSIEGIDSVSIANTISGMSTVKLAVTLDLVTYYKFNGSAWEVIDINTNQDNMMDIATVTSINRSQWDLLTNGTASGIAFAYYLDISGIGDTVKIDKTSLVVDMKGEWNSAIKGTDFKYGYPANDRLKVTLLTTGNYKINYVGG